VKIKHPTIPGITRQVENVEEWLAAGWLPDEEPAGPAPQDSSGDGVKPEPKPSRRRTRRDQP